MNRNQWHRAKDIFNTALELKPEERAGYLDDVCAGDVGLRSEVEKLLASYRSEFMEERLAPSQQDEHARYVQGSLLGRYEIVRLLGAGGMGEVYLAKDKELRRKVAIKVLNTKYENTESNIQRFMQEAKAASALNHPNILTIHEIGQTENSHYIVSEYIDGRTLRTTLQTGKLPLSRILDITIQVASALSAAHSAHIIHRDIKPENISLRDDGYVKVLDFGLAKVMRSFAGLDDETIKLNQTSEGLILGTVRYMSPEQARAAKVDERTDIFSLGVVVYEMIAGRTPFEGDSTSDAFANLINKDPKPLSQFVTNLPDELQRIVSKMLRKDADERYQTMKHLISDLKELKERITVAGDASAGELDTAVLPSTSDGTRQIETADARRFTRHAVGNGNAWSLVNRFTIVASLIILILVGSSTGVFYFTRSAPIDSLAVMPFVNETGNPESEYLSDGITESLIGRLSQIPDLSVKARSSVFRFKGRDVAIKEIGRELSVPGILVGRLARRGNEYNLYVELVDTATEKVIWQAAYKRPESSLATIPGDIARDVASKLREKLSRAEEQSITRNYTDNSAAYELYLKGRFYWDKRNEESYKVAEDAYRQAIALDPNYALAYAGLADCYLFREIGLGRDVAMPKAKEFALKALEIDESLAEAHTTLGFVKANYELDFAAGEREFRRAIELKPSYAIAHQFYGSMLVATGRTDGALAEMRKALDLEPYSTAINWSLGMGLGFARRYDEAIVQFQKTLQIQPNYALAEGNLTGMYIQTGRYDDATGLIEKLLAIPERRQGALANLAIVYAKTGRESEARKTLGLLLRDVKSQNAPYGIARVYAALGEKDEAIRWLNNGYEKRSFSMFFLRVDPFFDTLHDDPRFQELLRRIGLTS